MKRDRHISKQSAALLQIGWIVFRRSFLNPTCVAMSDSAMDALARMIGNRCRHLPVVDDIDAICVVLDTGKCLNDAISKLDHNEDKTK